MADNTTLNPGSGGVTVADDDIGGIKYQRVKLIHGVDGTNDGDTARSNPLPVSDFFSTRSDTFTATGNGTTVDVSTKPCTRFGLQVKATGAGITSWSVVLEGSLNNTQFTTVLEHNSAAPPVAAVDGETVWVEGGPFLYFRSRCAALNLGTATNVVATIVGK